MIPNVSKSRSWPADSLTRSPGALPRPAPGGDTLANAEVSAAVEARLVAILEHERRRIALDLHDGLGQALSLIKLSVERSASLLADGSSDEAARTLQSLLPRVREALCEVRRVSTELRPPMLDDLGILPTLNWLLREFEAACGQTVVDKVLDVGEEHIPGWLQITLYRILQEATHNIVKHAHARYVRVYVVHADGMLHLLVEDDGRGFLPPAARRTGSGGLGLLGMRERASLSGGRYRLQSRPGHGTRISVVWPIRSNPLPPE